MTEVLNQVRTHVKDVAYTSIGVNLLVTDAIVGREVKAPKVVADYAAEARKQATEALTTLRGRTEPIAIKFANNLPDSVGDKVISGRTAAWKFIGIEAPVVVEETAAKPAAKKATTKKA